MDWNNQNDVLRALLFLHSRQTLTEQNTGVTINDNGVGFNAVDAPFLTSISNCILYEQKPLTHKQYMAMQSIIIKYSRQIDEMQPDHPIPKWAKVLPPSSQLTSDSDGNITISKDMIKFYSNIYPSDIIKEYGFSWSKDEKCWRGKLSVGNMNVIERLFINVTYEPEALEWRIKQTSIGPKTTEIESSPMFDYQKEATYHLLKNDKMLLALAPGLGKTIVSLIAAHYYGGRVLIVCPVSLMLNWRNEIYKWIGTEEDVEIWHKEVGYDADWIICNYDTLRLRMCSDRKGVRKHDPKVLFDFNVDIKVDTFIVDETILIKNRKAQRRNAVDAVAKESERVWFLSGAPTSRFYDDLWSQLNILKPMHFRSYWRFAEAYCEVIKDQWGYKITANKDHSHEHIQRDLEGIYFARTQDQVLDLPDWIMEDIEIEMHPEQARIYNDIEKDFMSLLPEGDMLVTPNILSQMTRMIQIASNPSLIESIDVAPKWDAVQEMLLFVEKPVLIWTNFVKTAAHMSYRLKNSVSYTPGGYKVDVIIGASKPDERQRHVDRFQNNDLDILIAHPAVGKFGLTLTAAKTAIYLERSYNGDDYYQSLHRVRRIGTRHSPYVIHLLATNKGKPTIDHVISRVLRYRKESAIKLTTGMILKAYEGEIDEEI